MPPGFYVCIDTSFRATFERVQRVFDLSFPPPLAIGCCAATAASDTPDVTSIANLTREIAHNALPCATNDFHEMFGKLCNVGDFERHIADVVAALQ